MLLLLENIYFLFSSYQKIENSQTNQMESIRVSNNKDQTIRSQVKLQFCLT
jgi:hypothetical protein